MNKRTAFAAVLGLTVLMAMPLLITPAGPVGSPAIARSADPPQLPPPPPPPPPERA